MISQCTRMAVLMVGLVGAFSGTQAADAGKIDGSVPGSQSSDTGTIKTTRALTVSPSKLVTYPGYQTIFTAKDGAGNQPLATTWFLSGEGAINQNRFEATVAGRAVMLARGPAGEATTAISIEEPTAKIEGRTIANFEDVVPTAISSAVSGIWQWYNTSGTYRRIVDNPHPDAVNPTPRCSQVDRQKAHGSQVFASKDTVLLGGRRSTIELLVFGDTLTNFRWKALLAGEKGGSGDKSELAGQAENIVAGRWNRVTIPLGAGAGKYLRYVSLFANPETTSPEIFYVDEVRWVE